MRSLLARRSGNGQMGMKLVKCECRHRRRDLRCGRCVISQRTGVGPGPPGLDEDPTAVRISGGACDLSIPSCNVCIGSKDRDPATRVAHQILHFPVLCRHDDDSSAIDRICNRRDETLRRQFMRARALAFPDGHPQERAIGFVSFLNQYGPALVGRMASYQGGNLRPSAWGSSASYGLGEVHLLAFDTSDEHAVSDPWVKLAIIRAAMHGLHLGERRRDLAAPARALVVRAGGHREVPGDPRGAVPAQARRRSGSC